MSRERLTITLKSDLLKVLDNLIDGDQLRNRSHAIEYYLSKALGAKAVKILILAGGKAVNFGNGRHLPKAMAQIAGKPLLEHTIERLRLVKPSEVIISVGQGGKEIQNFFSDGSQYGLNISYLEQSQKIRGTAQALLQAQAELSGSHFLLLYGDVLTNINFDDLLDFHRQQQNTVVTMALSSAETVSMWGLARLNGSKIVDYEEKPQKPKTHSHLVNAGIYVMEPAIFKYIKPADQKLESDVFPRLAEEGKMGGYPFEGLWFDISTIDIYKQAVREWK